MLQCGHGSEAVENRDKKNAAARERKKQRIAKRVEAAKAKLPSVRGTLYG